MIELMLIMISLGFGMAALMFVGISLVQYVTAAQMRKYKIAYLKAVLRQDVGWYDISNPEELSTVFAEAMGKIQKGLKAQGMLGMGFGYGFGALVMAFLPGIGEWRVALVTCATLPLLAVSATIMMSVATGGDKVVAKAYAKAGGVATESMFS